MIFLETFYVIKIINPEKMQKNILNLGECFCLFFTRIPLTTLLSQGTIQNAGDKAKGDLDKSELKYPVEADLHYQRGNTLDILLHYN